jgi:hypothetical protein
VKKKPPPQSLIDKGPDSPPTIDELRKWGGLTRREQFLRTLTESKEQADIFEQHQGMERGVEYAARIRNVANLFEIIMRQIDSLDDSESVYNALMWAFDLGMWRALAVSDARFAHPVHQHRRMLKGKGFVRSKRPDNEELSKVLRSSATRAEAAKKLGVSERTLRRWLNE